MLREWRSKANEWFWRVEIDWHCICLVRCGAERARYRRQLREEKVRGLVDCLLV